MKDIMLVPSLAEVSNSGTSKMRRASRTQIQLSAYLRDTFDSVMTETQNQSIQETVKKESPRLLDFIRRRIPDTVDAEDILQDVFFQFIEATRLTKPIENAGAWLYTVARNRITDMFRKKKPESLEKQLIHSREEDGEMLNLSDILPAQNDSPDIKMLRSTIMEELEEALHELPEGQREVFILHEIDGKSFKEISETTGASVNTLLSRKRYAVLFLRERLKELYDELMEK